MADVAEIQEESSEGQGSGPDLACLRAAGGLQRAPARAP